MYAVGRIGSYISQGVYTVSGPFHPFGGAVDIIVVEQPDGSFKSSPWYVRFGKFQGVLKTKEKVVNINVNGVDANFNMCLDHKGEAYFLEEFGVETGETVVYPSSGDETDGQSNSNRRPIKSKSYNYDADKLNSEEQIDASNAKGWARTGSRQARILGLVFGRRSRRGGNYQEGECDADVVRLSSLERAEIAADLLEMKWSTNLVSNKSRKDNFSHGVLDDKVAKSIQVNGEETCVDSSVHNDRQNRNVHSILEEETASPNEQMTSSSNVSPETLDSSNEEASVSISCIGTMEQVGESILEENSGKASEISRTIDEFGVGNAYRDEHEDQSCLDSKIKNELEACHGKQFDEEQACDKKDVVLSGCRISAETASDRVQSFVYCGTSENSILGLDGTYEKTQETLYLASGKCGKVHVHPETLHVTTELPRKDTDVERANDIELEKDAVAVYENHSDQVKPAVFEYNETYLEEPLKIPASSTNVVRLEPTLCSIEEVNSKNICTIPNEVREWKDISDDLQYVKSTGDSQELYADSVLKKAVSNSLSENSEEEQFLFSDPDEFKLSKVQCMESSSSDCAIIGDHPAFSSEGIKEVNGSVNANDEACSSLDMFGQYNQLNDLENSTEELRVMSSPISIHRRHKADEEVGRLVESLPNMRSPTIKLGVLDSHHPLSHSLDSNSQSLKWTLFKEHNSSPMKSDVDGELYLAEEQPKIENSKISKEQTNFLSNPAVGVPAEAIVSPGGSWSLWPFSLRRSSYGKVMQPALTDTKSFDTEVASESINDTKSVCKPKLVKKTIRALTPTSEQLAALHLKEGRNTVTFTFSTAMLGKQQVDARIYLWKWNTRIVISDVDGTITKSDVLGQFMPLVGMDWSQTGVAHLFSAIKENGYQLLFLSARAISQAYHTRQFLFNLKQDGKALPDGPVVISPDGLFPSLFREVIRRAPHEFKISCLEDIRALFPSDCNPFYAGFGNRDTDEISYLKVGIPSGKIFTINPKGEIAVNRRIDTKSYSLLHALVHGMFPPTNSTEQEDFNAWNYWKLPPPDIDV